MVMFRKSNLSEEYAAIIAKIEEGDRHIPQHEQPRTISDSGFAMFVTPGHEVLFEDFEWFGAVMNHNLADPWAVEETPDTLLTVLEDTPDVGRTYRVFYNVALLGKLQICVHGISGISSRDDFLRDRGELAVLNLRYLRFVPYHDVHQLLTTLYVLIGPFVEREAAYARASQAATALLTGHLWECVRMPDIVPDFEACAAGPYDLLRKTTDHWKKNRVDPFAKWDGDRPNRSPTQA
jgi:hypothetical protein